MPLSNSMSAARSGCSPTVWPLCFTWPPVPLPHPVYRVLVALLNSREYIQREDRICEGGYIIFLNGSYMLDPELFEVRDSLSIDLNAL